MYVGRWCLRKRVDGPKDAWIIRERPRFIARIVMIGKLPSKMRDVMTFFTYPPASKIATALNRGLLDQLHRTWLEQSFCW